MVLPAPNFEAIRKEAGDFTVDGLQVLWIWASQQVALVQTANLLGGNLTIGSSTLLSTTVPLTNGAGAQAGTLLNAPVAGNPTKWIPINDNGTIRYIPAW